MCLAIPAQIADIAGDEQASATVDIMGVRRKVNLQLLADDPPTVGDWVLVHVGFAMCRISEQQAAEQLDMLRQMGEAAAAHEEASGYSTGSALSGG